MSRVNRGALCGSMVKCQECVPSVIPSFFIGVDVTVLADRGFADRALFEFLEELGFGYVNRLRGNY